MGQSPREQVTVRLPVVEDKSDTRRKCHKCTRLRSSCMNGGFAPVINIPWRSRGYLLYGRSPMLPATPHAAWVRLAICIGRPTHTGISPSPFPPHIAAIPYIYTFFFCLIIFHQQSLLLSHNLLNCFCHFILEWLPSIL